MPAMLEDPTAPAIFRTSGKPPYPTPSNPQIPDTIVPRRVTLRDRITIASLLPFSNPNDVPPRLLSYLCSQLNLEIEKGDTYPMITQMSLATFGTYWFQNFGAIMLLGEVSVMQDVAQMEARGEKWEEVCLGSFYIKPNYPGRSSHICNGGFLVTEAARNRGVGRLMGEGYLEWAPKLGYTYSVFNLVYETNVASCRIWDALGFKRVGRIKGCGNLRSNPDELVDAIMYGRDLGPEGDDFISEERFDKIKFYLKHGTYPSGADRAEKSRLRSAATHYKLLPDETGQGEKLMLKDKEVVSDPLRQYEIAKTVHAQQHGGINKTTATIAEKFHWVRIKETVTLVIKNCQNCKEPGAKVPPVRPSGDNGVGMSPQSRRAAGSNSPNNSDPNSMIERLVNFDQMEANKHAATPKSKSTSSPEKFSHSPISNMRIFQGYQDIPLDPQIIAQQHANGYYNHESTVSPPIYGNINPSRHVQSYQQSMNEGHIAGDDTRMATERHIRRGDEPMAYQDGRGVIHAATPDGVNGVTDGHPNVEMALEDLLTRES
ncbi:Protein spt10 [Lecanora helva]